MVGAGPATKSMPPCRLPYLSGSCAKSCSPVGPIAACSSSSVGSSSGFGGSKAPAAYKPAVPTAAPGKKVLIRSGPAFSASFAANSKFCCVAGKLFAANMS